MYALIDNHIHSFWGSDCASDEPPLVRYFSLTATQDDGASIDVVVSTQGDTLQLSYFVGQNGVWQNNGTFDKSLMRADFLWEQTCFECFFDFGGDGYFELNFSPKGAYNLYRFDAYRTPPTLPPNWADGNVSTIQGVAMDAYDVYHLTVKLNNTPAMDIYKVNPTAIIYQDGTPNFYAVRHATPPDFHDKAFWQEF